jgi:tol-pal system beta propeller repeat protein TolB
VRACKLCSLAIGLVLVALGGSTADARNQLISGSLVFDARPDARGAYGWQLFVANLDSGRVRRLRRDDGAVWPSWSPDASEVVYEQADSQRRCDKPACAEIWRINARGKHARRLTSLSRRSESPDWSRTGKIVYVRWFGLDDGIETDIYTIESNGGGVRRLTDTRGEDNDPAWSPDGQRIAFSSDRGKNFEIYLMNADGSDQQRLTNTADADEYGAAWSPDGTQIAFWRRGGGADGDAIVVANADGTGERTLTGRRESAISPAWSPDGQRIAYVKDTDDLDGADIWVMRADGREKRKLIDGPFSEPSKLDWAP